MIHHLNNGTQRDAHVRCTVTATSPCTGGRFPTWRLGSIVAHTRGSTSCQGRSHDALNRLLGTIKRVAYSSCQCAGAQLYSQLLTAPAACRSVRPSRTWKMAMSKRRLEESVGCPQGERGSQMLLLGVRQQYHNLGIRYRLLTRCRAPASWGKGIGDL